MMATNTLLILTAVITIWTDSRRRKIYNIILGPIFLLALFYNAYTGGWQGLLLSLTGTLVGFLLLLLPYRFGGVGGGDVKLLAVFGALLGARFVLTAFLYGAILGGLLAGYKMLRKEKTIAYGVPLSLGAIVAVLFPWGAI